MFIDLATLTVQAGKGGDGITSFRHERLVAKGGPDGGDGGRGGNVILLADHNLNTLEPFRHQPLIHASDGQNGGRAKRHGKNGEDKVVKVPVGTTVWLGEALLVDMTKSDQAAVIAQGGRGGFGNAHFTSSVRRRPDVSEAGEAGEQKELRLELKLIADVGLVGLPNAGKSTLLSVVSNAKPKIADYPFTTLSPNLGVVTIDNKSFLMADIPGLIEGASQGKGMGDEFLRHVERTSVILHLIDGTEADVVAAWQTVKGELKAYPADLSHRPQLVVLTKIDALPPSDVRAKKTQLVQATKLPVLAISAVAHKGLPRLLRQTWELIQTAKKVKKPASKPAPKVFTLADDPDAWWVEKKAGRFIVRGQKIEGFGRRTKFDQESGLARLRDIMQKYGISRELIRLGAKTGDPIEIAGKSFKW